MKRLIIATLLLIMGIGLTACSSKEVKTTKVGTKIQVEQASKGTFADLKVIPQFKVKDINDKEVINDIFKNKKVTMINIWGTFCGPCVEELPPLEELYKEYQSKGFNLIGVVADGETNEVQAMLILKKTKSDFINLIPNEKFKDDFVNKTKAVPVSVLVNSKGKILETVVGSRSKGEYKKIIERNLLKIK
jgi:thiol-disulfide isomerase/thioredoxin